MRNWFKDYQNKTCIIMNGDEVVFTSEYKGVRPMMEYMKAFGPSELPLTVIDRVMGRGAVMLAVLIGATSIKTPLISESALELAEHHKLEIEYDKRVPYIMNRTGDGQCPIEASVLGVTDIQEGYETIKATIAELMSR